MYAHMTIETIPMGFFDGVFFNDPVFFLLLMITLLGGVLGATSGFASIGAFGAFALFVHVATQVDLWIFQGLLYVFLTVLFVSMAATVWGFISSSGVQE